MNIIEQPPSITKEVTVRPYKKVDYEKCREIFTEGMQQLVSPVFNIVLPRYLKIASIFLIFVSVAAFRWSLWLVGLYFLCCVIMTALLYIDIYLEVMKFVSACLNSDLLDITESYNGLSSRMFVAEFHGQVVGLVGLMHEDKQHKPGVAELQRMTVSRSIRRKGVAKLLCRELTNFAKKQNLNKIILSTTTAQQGAIELYKKCGFRLTNAFPHPQKILDELKHECYELDMS